MLYSQLVPTGDVLDSKVTVDRGPVARRRLSLRSTSNSISFTRQLSGQEVLIEFACLPGSSSSAAHNSPYNPVQSMQSFRQSTALSQRRTPTPRRRIPLHPSRRDRSLRLHTDRRPRLGLGNSGCMSCGLKRRRPTPHR